MIDVEFELTKEEWSVLRAAAKAKGMCLNAFVGWALDQQMRELEGV